MDSFSSHLLRGLGVEPSRLAEVKDTSAQLVTLLEDAYFTMQIAREGDTLDLGKLKEFTLKDERIVATAVLITLARSRHLYLTRAQRCFLLKMANERWNNTTSHLEAAILGVLEIRYQGLHGSWLRCYDRVWLRTKVRCYQWLRTVTGTYVEVLAKRDGTPPAVDL
jgi:hypothetical protein